MFKRIFFFIIIIFLSYSFPQDLQTEELLKHHLINERGELNLPDGFDFEFKEPLVLTESVEGNWLTLGNGVNGAIYCITGKDSFVYAGGFFTDASGVTANRIAKWNGVNWEPLGVGVAGLNPSVNAIDISSDNKVYAGGVFNLAGGIPAKNIAVWNGNNWSNIGAGINGGVYAIAVKGDSIYAGGFFTTAGESSARNIALWTGSEWEALGSGVNNVVRSIRIFDNKIIAGGEFDSAGTKKVNYIASWDGKEWNDLDGGFDFYVYSLDANEDYLIAGGIFDSTQTQDVNYLAKWNGSSWSSVGNGVNSIVYSVILRDDILYAGGIFTQAGGIPVNLCARWNGSNWFGLNGGVNNVVFGIAKNNSGIFFGGNFSTAGALSANRIAQWTDGINIPVYEGWNLVSVPRIPFNFSADYLFRKKSGEMFGFINTYGPADTLANGYGYWVKYLAHENAFITGPTLDNVQINITKAGWALLGSVSLNVPVSNITTAPPNSIASSFFRWNSPEQTYETASEITPGEGYWVKFNQPCIIMINSSD